MRMALSRMTDRRPFMLIGEPYFHGEILTDYQPDKRGSRWLPWRPLIAPEGGRRYRSGMLPMAPQTTTNLVRQDIVMEATTSTRRFAIVPTQPLWDMTLIPYGAPPPRSDAEAILPPRQQRYSVATSAIRNQRQLHAIPNPNRLQTLWDCTAFSDEEQRALAFDQSRFPRMAQMAEEVLKQQELVNGKTLDKILALERHFHAPDLYRYSLNLDFVRDRQLDPIEDFVANHRTGHCQYFASALVLMLRSQGIPARMVVGFRGGAFNSVGQYYLVQGRHSHAWVEAWLSAEEVPDWELAGVGSEGGAWYRLDPTPGRELNIAISEDGVANRVAQAFDYVELLWRDYVLSLNSNRQEDLVYDPLTARVAFFLPGLNRGACTAFSGGCAKSRASWDSIFRSIASAVGLARFRWVSWRWSPSVESCCSWHSPGHPAWLASDSAMAARKKATCSRPSAGVLSSSRAVTGPLAPQARPGQTPHELASVAHAASSGAQAGTPLPRACHRKSWPRTIGFDSGDTAWTMRKVRR